MTPPRLTVPARPASLRSVKTSLPFAVAALVLLAACPGTKEKAVVTPNVLRGVPIVDGSQLLDTSGTAEAMRATLFVQLTPDSVAGIYRRFFLANGWRIVGDVSDQGGIDLYVERQGPPLWIQLRSAGKGFTRYTLIGAVGREVAKPDSAAGGTGRPPVPGGAGH
jgi:hypothetical protein